MQEFQNGRIRENALFFHRCLEQVRRCIGRGDWNSALGWATCGGRLGWKAHPGFYMSYEMESLLLEIGRKLPDGNKNPSALSKRGQRHWLHVMTAAAAVGGHTRFVERWIKRHLEMNEDLHSLLILEQKRCPVPEWLNDIVGVAGGSVVHLSHSSSFVDRALELRNAARAVDVIVQHVHPNETLPSAAFTIPDLPPVLYLNHADHVYWTGLSSADRIIDIRREGRALTYQRRTEEGLEFLPIPLLRRVPGNKFVSRQRLGLPSDMVVALSIGGEYKFKPYGGLNFIDAALELCLRYKDMLILVIGPNGESAEWKQASERCQGRLKALGTISQIEDYYNACDIYLESFPLGSLTATLDAPLYGKPVVKSPCTILPILSLDSTYDGLGASRDSMTDYFNDVGTMVLDPGEREDRGARQLASVCGMHVGEGWGRYLGVLIDNLPTGHLSKPPTATQMGLPGPQDTLWAEMQSASGASVHRSFRGGLRSLKNHISPATLGWNKMFSYVHQTGIFS